MKFKAETVKETLNIINDTEVNIVTESSNTMGRLPDEEYIKLSKCRTGYFYTWVWLDTNNYVVHTVKAWRGGISVY
jgi:hypothetical protein